MEKKTLKFPIQYSLTEGPQALKRIRKLSFADNLKIYLPETQKLEVN